MVQRKKIDKFNEPKESAREWDWIILQIILLHRYKVKRYREKSDIVQWVFVPVFFSYPKKMRALKSDLSFCLISSALIQTNESWIFSHQIYLFFVHLVRLYVRYYRKRNNNKATKQQQQQSGARIKARFMFMYELRTDCHKKGFKQ